MTDYSVDTPEGEHVIRVDGRSIILPNHPDLRGELTLVALGGLPCPCVTGALLLEYASHPADPSDPSFLASLPVAVLNQFFARTGNYYTAGAAWNICWARRRDTGTAREHLLIVGA